MYSTSASAMTSSMCSTMRYLVPFSSSSARNSGVGAISSGERMTISASNWERAYPMECMVRIRWSPMHTKVLPSTEPISFWTV